MVQAHDVGDRGVEEMDEGGWKDGHVDMLPGEREDESRDALRYRHQTLVI